MSVMNYKGFAARVEYDEDDDILVGRLAGIQDVVGFHAEDVKGLRKAFEEAVDDYVETCAKVGKEPQKPYSGKVMFRIDPETHRAAAIAAELAGKSLNQWAEEAIDSALGRVALANSDLVNLFDKTSASSYNFIVKEHRHHGGSALAEFRERLMLGGAPERYHLAFWNHLQREKSRS